MLISRYGGDRLRESFQSYCERMELEVLIEQWDTQRNLPLAPDQISYGSKRKVWWQCEKAIAGRQRYIPEPAAVPAARSALVR